MSAAVVVTARERNITLETMVEPKKKRPNRPTSQLSDSDAQLMRDTLKWRAITELGRAAIKWVGFVVVMLFVWLCVRELAGERTQVLVDMLVDWQIKDVALLAAAVAGGTLSAKERSLRKKAYEQLGELREKYERLMDPKRDSSGLRRDGETEEKLLP